MITFLRFCSIISIIIASLKLAMIGGLTPNTTVFVIVCGLLIAFGNKNFFTIAAAAAALVLFIKVNGGTSVGQAVLLQSILALGFAVFGIYLVVRNLFSRGR
jgi:hypothetical protein